jgi:glycine/D-amino acid oxidase-like deaminating enzyme/nitrite reductase/ring-hydroxylating ferredoxin subunit
MADLRDDYGSVEHYPKGSAERFPLPEDPRSIWIKSEPGERFPELEGNLRVDVAIVGGGITGLTAAALLKRAGKKVAVIEARCIAGGESGRTTAHLTEHPDVRWKSLLRDFGYERASLVWESSRAAITLLERMIAMRGLSCGFRRVPAYLYTERNEGVAALEEELDAMKKLGIPATLVRGAIPLPFRVAGALRFDQQAQFHVRQYLLPLAREIDGDGSHVLENTRALEIDERRAPHVVTRRGTIQADDVIVATNVPINNRVLLQTKIAHYRTYAIGALLDGPVPEGLYWDDEQPYHYVRGQRVGDHNYLIAGGEDHRTGETHDTCARFRELAAWTSIRFPVRSIEYRWSGQVIEPVDGLPYIGRNAFAEHVWEATGFSGTGMSGGTMAAMLLADAILGRKSRWLEIYAATRITPLVSAKHYLRQNVAFPKHFVADRLKRDSQGIDALPPGSGGLTHVNGRKVAAYRDLDGELHVLSPVCTHLRCLVEFNSAEKSWDCPCHGSRFDIDGAVLNGPAVRPLEVLSRRKSDAAHRAELDAQSSGSQSAGDE